MSGPRDAQQETRMGGHYLGMLQDAVGNPMSDRKNNSPVHMALSLLGFVTAGTLVVMSIVVSSKVLGEGCKEQDQCQAMLYITTTFLSSRRIETSLGWPVATERDLANAQNFPYNVNDPAQAYKDRTYRFGHFIECMYTARMADKTCPPTATLSEYTTCITNSTLITGLDNCAAFPSVGGYSHWPTSEEYLQCVWNNPLLQNTESRRASQNVFRACMDRQLWPFFEVPQTIDSPILFGSYNWALLLLAGIVVMSSFAVYTASPKEEGALKYGESSVWMRLGLLWSGIALVWNLIYLIIFLIIGFRNTGEFQKGGGLPTTFSTTYVTVGVLGAAFLYFLAIVLKPARFKYVYRRYSSAKSNIAVIEPVHVDAKVNDFEMQGLLQGTFPETNPRNPMRQDKIAVSEDDVARFYTPPMLAIWADSYMADFCIVMGVAGATGQLSTDTAWHLFALTLSYRLLNMIISRCISDAFTNNLRLSDAVNQTKNDIVTRPSMFFRNVKGYVSNPKHGYDVHINTKVIGFSTQLAAGFLYACLLALVFNGNTQLNEFTIFKNFFITCFVVPEALRLVIHLYYQVFYGEADMNSVPWALYNSFYVIWLWDVIWRLIWVCVVVLETSNNPGTFDYLRTQTGTLMRDYVVQMTI